MSIGIVSTGVYIPSTFLTSQEISEKSGLPLHVIEEKMGIKKKPIPGPEDHTCEMGIRAAKKAIEKGNVHPENIDLVIYIGEEYKEYPLWTAGIKLQEEIGAKNAWAFDIALRCGTTVMALQVAKSLMLTDDSIQTVLLAGGYRNGDFIDFDNPRTRFMYNLGAGGAAIILQKGMNRNLLLEGSVITDGAFSEDVIVPVGGTRQPFSQGFDEKQYKLEVPDPEGMKRRLEEKSLTNFLKVIRKSLTKSGLSEADIHYAAMLHMKRSAHQYILNALGLAEHQSIYLEEHGHIGQMDQILSLELALEQGKIADGDVIVMVSAGIGYAWASTVVKWGSSIN